jgi:hypothetical protein
MVSDRLIDERLLLFSLVDRPLVVEPSLVY